jgi:uncharacterized protein
VRSILVDTGPLVALFKARDRHHGAAKAIVEANPAELITTWPAITEACHFLRQEGKRALLAFIRRGGLRVESLTRDDIPRLDEVLARHDSMDFADACLVVVAEKAGVLEVMTVDRRDFEAYRTRSGARFKLLVA